MGEEGYACSLTDEDLAARRREWKDLAATTRLRSETIPGGRLVVYRGGEETARILSGLVEAERECCPFLAFEIEQRADEVRLAIRYPAEARATAVELGVTRPG